MRMQGLVMAVFLWGVAAGGGGCEDFVRRSCSGALYRSLCYSSLEEYVCAAGGADPTGIAHFAANLSLVRVSAVSSHVGRLRRGGGGDGAAAAALADCAESLGDAAELSREAAAEIGLLGSARGTDVAWHVSNAQTWMSAALTDEETCADGLRGGGAGGVVWGDVVRRVRRARQYTSNALALVNRLVGVRR
ncbi:21 kDa protein-like [Wolffia australiana]